MTKKIPVIINTYRRIEEVQRCVNSIDREYFIPWVFYPPDEQHTFDSNVLTTVIPKELIGVGAGGPRAFAMEHVDSEYAIIMDDDAYCTKNSKMQLLINDLKDYKNLATVDRKPSWPPKKGQNNIAEYLQKNHVSGIIYAVRMNAYNEVGGFNPNLAYYEDVEISKRYQIANWEMASDMRVNINFKVYARGGLDSVRKEKNQTVDEMKLSSLQIIFNTWPENCFRPAGKRVTGPVWKKGKLIELQEKYKDGKLSLSSDGVKML